MNEEEKPRKFFSSVRKHMKRKETMRGHEDEDLNIEVTFIRAVTKIPISIPNMESHFMFIFTSKESVLYIFRLF